MITDNISAARFFFTLECVQNFYFKVNVLKI